MERNTPCRGDWEPSLYRASTQSRSCILVLGLALVRLGGLDFFANASTGAMSGHARTLATALIYGFESPLDDQTEKVAEDDDTWWEARDRAAELFEAELARFTGGDVGLVDLVERVSSEERIARLTRTRRLEAGGVETP